MFSSATTSKRGKHARDRAAPGQDSRYASARTPVTLGLTGVLLAGFVGALPAPAWAADGDTLISSSWFGLSDGQGTKYAPEQGFTGGYSWSTTPSTPITGTSDDDLYRTEWVGMSRFSRSVAPGTYDVTLRMAEIYWDAPGERVFDVTAEGVRVLDDVDIVAAVGRDAAYDRTFRVSVGDGSLDLGFHASVDLPKVGAIKIERVSDAEAATAPSVAADAVAAPAPAAAAPAPAVAPPAPVAAAPAPAPAPVVAAPAPAPVVAAPAPAPVAAAPAPVVAGPAPVPAAAPAASGGRPGPTNTGVPAGTRLTPYWGDLTITTPGATYDAMDIHGFVTIKAPNVRITRSIVRGGVATGNVGLITNYDTSATGLLVQDSELVPEYPSVWLDGIKGGNFTIRRVNSWGTTDNVKVHGDNVTVDSSWLHGTVYRLVDPNQGGGPTHNDAVQILGGRNLRILNSTLEEGHNSAVQVTQTTAPVTDLVIGHNWIDGGGCSVNLSNKGLATMSGITVDDNRFGRHQTFSGCAMIVTRATTLDQWSNVWDDTSTPIRLTDGG